MNLQKGLIGHWTMDDSDTSGNTIYDRSAYNSHGTLINSPTTGKNGVVNESYSFIEGNNEIVNVGLTNLTQSHPLTVSAWIYIDSNHDNTEACVIGNYDNGDGLIFRTRPSNADKIELWFNSGHSTKAGAVTERDEFVHILATWDGSTVRYYKNGTLFDQVGTNNSITSTTNSFRLASRGDNNKRADLTGKLDDVRLYNRVLLPDEVLALSNMRSQRNQNLVKNVSFYDVSDLYSNSGHPGSKSGLDNFFDASRSDVYHILTRKHDRSTVNHGLEGQSTSEFGSVNSEPYYFTRSNSYSWKIEGQWTAPETGVYEFGIDADDAADVLIDNNPVATFYGGHGFDGSVSNHSGTVSLIKGERYKVSLRYEEGGGGSGLTVGYKKPSDSSYVLFPAENIF